MRPFWQIKKTYPTQKQYKNIVWMKKDLLTIEEDLKLVPRESDSQLVPLVICQVDRERLHSLHHSVPKSKTHSEIAGKVWVFWEGHRIWKKSSLYFWQEHRVLWGQQRTCQKVNEDFSKQMWSSRIIQTLKNKIFSCRFLNPNFFSDMNYNCSFFFRSEKPPGTS